MDNLNTYNMGSLYGVFCAEKVRSLVKCLEIDFTSKHCVGLMLLSELSVLSGQCLGRWIPDIETLNKQLSVWERDRNNLVKQVNWHFTTKQARGKTKTFVS